MPTRLGRSTKAALLAVGAAACALGPNHKTPPAEVPVAWRDTTQNTQDTSYANLPWWEVLGDTTLQGLIRVSLKENRDLRIALARVNEARALLGIQRLEFWPQIDVGGSFGQRQIADTLNGMRTGQYGFYQGHIAVTWELDLWGRLRRLNESARAKLLATEYGRRGVIVTVVGDVARAYLELRDFDQQVVLAQATVETRRQSLELARARFDGGLTSELDVRQGEAELAGAESRVARLRRQGKQKEHELNVLLGRMPGTVPRGDPLAQQRLPTQVPAGLPSTLLQRRPDVLAAEEDLRAANARIGAAIAAMFPTISLTGVAGTRSDDISELFQVGTGFWNLAANLFAPILNSGRNRRQVQVERARTEGAVARYDQIVIGAFREVEDGLIALEQLQIEVAAAGRQVAARGGRLRSRPTATKVASTATSRCSTHSACSRTPSWRSPACSANCAWPWCSCTSPWAAAGTR